MCVSHIILNYKLFHHTSFLASFNLLETEDRSKAALKITLTDWCPPSLLHLNSSPESADLILDAGEFSHMPQAKLVHVEFVGTKYTLGYTLKQHKNGKALVQQICCEIFHLNGVGAYTSLCCKQ